MLVSTLFIEGLEPLVYYGFRVFLKYSRILPFLLLFERICKRHVSETGKFVTDNIRVCQAIY